ncbi:retrotransposon-related protein [Tanacetum coccineum]
MRKSYRLRRITTPAQMKWLPKLMSFDYEILYKKGSENEAVDALSRVATCGKLLQMILSFLPKIVESWSTDHTINTMIQNLKVEAKLILLQPLPIPTLVWSEISMDFVEGLSNSHGKTVAQLFLDNVHKLHGLSKVIVSDRDKIYLSLFWKELIKMLQVYDWGKTKEWAKWLPLAEYWYNTNFHTSIKTTPLEAVYGQPPSSPILYFPYRNVDSVDVSLATCEAIIQMMQFHLARAQSRMKAVANLHRIEVLKWVLEKVGMIAYKLLLPMTAQIHPVFHVLQLKLFNGDPIAVQSVLPQCDPNGSLVCVPVKELVTDLEMSFLLILEDKNHLKGMVTNHEPKPGGRNIRVTEETKHEYVDLVAEHILTNAIRPQINSFLEGFNELISCDLISLFNDKELELLISGLPEIDLDDLKVPLEGFKALQGISVPQRFQIHKAYGAPERLPSAHTWLVLFNLPKYTSKEQLQERLLLAIHEASEGFGFG